MKKDVDIVKRKKLMEEKLIAMLSKPNLTSSELKLVEEIEQKLTRINRELGKG